MKKIYKQNYFRRLQVKRLFDEAAVVFQQVVDKAPDWRPGKINLGIALQETGDLDAATDAYATALRLRPDSFGRIAQALTSGRTGILWLDLQALRRHLLERGSAGAH